MDLRLAFSIGLRRNVELSLVAAFMTLCAFNCALAEPPKPDSLEFFQQQVEPLLKSACYECHSHAAGEANGKLMVDSLTALNDGGTRGPAIRPGQPEESWLWKAVTYSDPELQMPPDGKLADDQVELLRIWIAAGAVAPKSEPMAKATTNAEEIAANHWAYQPPQPIFAGGAGTTSAHIDAIVRAKLSEKGLDLSPAADRELLLRRLYFDLSGLPPSREQIEQFINDPRGDNALLGETVDQLLASPRFGERWARYWMDLARYADTKGYVFQENREYPEAYRYRDWLVTALNNDLPYTEFIQKQLAADLGPKADPVDLPALGFLTLGRRFLNNKNDIIDDRLDVVSRGLMGMTLACARCHDHKYDPVTQADYYALYGVFLNTDEPGGEPFAHRMVDANEDRKSFILIRGSPRNRGEQVERRFVSFMSPDASKFDAAGSGRLQLAAKIVDDQNPLTARVLANRVWLRLMGASLTESPSDFGARCPPPVLQPLLDQLAVDFIASGWSMKELIRGIVLSQVYQQQSVHRDTAAEVDPANALYWRTNRRRRDFESLRDALLMTAGELDATMHGKAEKIHEQPFSHRRTVYAYIDRQNLPSVFRSFDFASPDSHSPLRQYTSVPQQGLYLMNSDFVAELAGKLGSRIETISTALGTEAALNQLFAEVLGRAPNAEETTLFSNFIAGKRESSEQLAERSLPERWICGYGKFNAETKLLSEFQRLPKFTGTSWQGVQGPPDPNLGWCILNRDGGHPGNDLNFAVVRRWIAPRDGKVRISGQLKHESKEGDGVRATILVDGAHELGQWTAANSEAKTETSLMMVQAGQTVDFVTDCISSPSHDSFRWQVRLRYQDGSRESFQSDKELPAPPKQPLNDWQQLAQALLVSNEFAFVD